MSTNDLIDSNEAIDDLITVLHSSFREEKDWFECRRRFSLLFLSLRRSNSFMTMIGSIFRIDRKLDELKRTEKKTQFVL